MARNLPTGDTGRAESAGDTGNAVYQRILIALDGSVEAEAILPAALAIATVERPEIWLFAATDGTSAEEARARVGLDRALRRLDGTAVLVRQALGGGDPAPAILHAANEVRADAIAMTTHGRGGVTRLLLGSTAEEVIRTGHLPVLVRRGARTPGRGPVAPRPLRCVLVPLDGTLAARGALEDAVAIALRHKARVTLVYVGPGRATDIHQPQGELSRDTAQAYLEGLALDLKARGVEAETLVTGGDVAATLAEIIGQDDIDLTVMATHGRSGWWERLTEGSVAETLLRSVSRPFLFRRAESP